MSQDSVLPFFLEMKDPDPGVQLLVTQAFLRPDNRLNLDVGPEDRHHLR